MSWRDQLRTASFRGAAFFVDEEQLNAGRRLALHEFPQRDLPYAEDLGRKARTFDVQAYLVGDDYLSAKQKLLAAIEEVGAGQLILPRNGEMIVSVTDCRVSESMARGGYCTFDLKFVEAGERKISVTVDANAKKNQALDAVFERLFSNVIQEFKMDGQPQSVADAIVNLIIKILNSSRGSKVLLNGAINDPSNPLYALLPDKIRSSIYDAKKIASALQLLAKKTPDLRNFKANYSPSINTPQRVIENKNNQLLTQLVVQSSVAQTVNDVAVLNYETRGDLQSAKQRVVLLVDQIINDSLTDSQTADYFTRFRQNALDVLNAQNAQLPTIIKRRFYQEMPALVAAYSIYGSSFLVNQKDVALSARNNIKNPLFVPAGVDIEVAV